MALKPLDDTKPLSIRAIRDARKLYKKRLAGDLVYRAASQLLKLSSGDNPKLSLAESLAVLLQSWNSQFFRFRKGFDETQLKLLKTALSLAEKWWRSFLFRDIRSFKQSDRVEIELAFFTLEIVLGPVGAAKALHMLSPSFFPLWDRKIAEKGYSIKFGKIGTNGHLYCHFVERVQKECLPFYKAFGSETLKALDEYNFVTITLIT